MYFVKLLFLFLYYSDLRNFTNFFQTQKTNPNTDGLVVAFHQKWFNDELYH